jgi:hypothetical protein
MRVNRWSNPLKRRARSNLVYVGWWTAHADLRAQEGDSCSAHTAGWGGHGESLRRSRGDTVGAKLDTDPVDRASANAGTAPGLPFPPVEGGGQVHRRLSAESGTELV